MLGVLYKKSRRTSSFRNKKTSQCISTIISRQPNSSQPKAASPWKRQEPCLSEIEQMTSGSGMRGEKTVFSTHLHRDTETHTETHTDTHIHFGLLSEFLLRFSVLVITQRREVAQEFLSLTAVPSHTHTHV